MNICMKVNERSIAFLLQCVNGHEICASDPGLEAVEAMRVEDQRRKSHAASVGHQPVQESESVDAVLGTMMGEKARHYLRCTYVV